MMDDERIIDLFFERSEDAMRELDSKYGAVCRRLSFNILNSRQDAEECVNDACLGAWNAIPPARPDPLLSYIVKIVRNISLKAYWKSRAARRGGQYAVALEELGVRPYQGYKATYGEVEGYLGVDLLISERLEAAIFGEGVDIQGSNLKGEKPVTSITLYSRHDTGAGMSGYIDMSVYISLGTSDAYQQVTRILGPESMEKDAALYEYVSQANGIEAKLAVYGALGRASAYFVYDGILYNISVGGFADEDDIDPAGYLEALIDTFR